MSDDLRALVFDIGSYSIKAGFGGDSKPACVVPSVVGDLRSYVAPALGRNSMLTHFVGRNALEKRAILTLKYPIEQGVVTNWDSVEELLDDTFRHELNVEPAEFALLLAEPSQQPTSQREFLVREMFETYNVAAYYSTISALLPLTAIGATTGVVVNSGHSVTEVVPIFESCPIVHAIKRLDIAGRHITQYLENERLDYDNIADAKQQCRVSINYEKEMDNVFVTCPEGLFQPSIYGYRDSDSPGIHEAVFKAIMACDAEIRSQLFQNVVLAGGNTMFRGLAERLQKELQKLAPNGVKVEVSAPDNRKTSVWIGGSMLSSILPPTAWISKQEYDEKGPSIVSKRCSSIVDATLVL